MTAGILLSQAVEGFLLARSADGYSPSTIGQYRWGLNFAINEIHKPVEDVTTDDLRRVMAKVQTGDLSPVSVFHVWKAIRAFYKWTSAEGLTERPDKLIAQPKFSYPEIRPFTQDDVKRILSATEHTTPSQGRKKSFVMSRPLALRDRVIVLVFIDTGIRASELCRLQVDDVDLQVGSITIKPFRSGLKSRGRTIPIGQSTRKLLWKYMAENNKNSGPVFTTLKDGELDRSDIFRTIQALGVRAGVKECHPHRLRHTFAITYLRNGGDIFTLQRILGHATLQMVQHYLALAESDDKDAHRRASPVDRWKL